MAANKSAASVAMQLSQFCSRREQCWLQTAHSSSQSLLKVSNSDDENCMCIFSFYVYS